MATISQNPRSGSSNYGVSGPTDVERKTGGSPTATQELKEKAGEVTEGLRDMASIATEAGREQIDHLKEMAAETYEEGMDYVQSWQRDLERTVRRQPLTSLMVAAGIGALLGVFWRKM